MKTEKSIAQMAIQNLLVEAHEQLTTAKRVAAQDNNTFTLDDVERLEHLAEQVELALADLCGVVKENSCI